MKPQQVDQSAETLHAERLRQAAIETARLIESGPGTSFRERPWAYVASGFIVALLIGLAVLTVLIAVGVVRPPPPLKGAFVPDWRCDDYGLGADVCERVHHTAEPKR